MVGSFSEDAISKFRDAMLNAGQQTNMPSRGQASTFVEEKEYKWVRNPQTGKLEITDGKPVEPKAPAKGKGKDMKLPKGATQPKAEGVTDVVRQAQRKGNTKAAAKQVTDTGKKAQQANLNKIEVQKRVS